MKKCKVLLDIGNNTIIFSPGYYMHFGTLLSLVSQMPEGTKTILKVKQKDITLKQILKRETNKK